MVGPFLGSLVYERLRYEQSVYVFGGLDLVAMLLCYIMIPGELNHPEVERQEDQRDEAEVLD